MTDAELIARLRYGEAFSSGASGKVMTNSTLDAAADRIEALTARLAVAEKVAEALREAHDQLWHLSRDKDDNYLVKQCRKALTEWKALNG